MKPPVRIVKHIEKIVGRVSTKLLTQLQTIDPLITGVQFLYGHYPDIRERLVQFGKTAKDERYPLVVMFEDFRVKNRIVGIFGEAEVKIMILWLSRKDITREQREASYLQILDPIYVEFFKQLRVSGLFMQYGPFVHERIDRPHWGDPAIYGNKGYLFDEILDGIEINNLILKTYFNDCVTA